MKKSAIYPLQSDNYKIGSTAMIQLEKCYQVILPDAETLKKLL